MIAAVIGFLARRREIGVAGLGGDDGRRGIVATGFDLRLRHQRRGVERVGLAVIGDRLVGRGVGRCRAALHRPHAPVLVGAQPGEVGLDGRQAVAILFRGPDDLRHLLLDRVEAVRQLVGLGQGGSGLVAEAGGVGRLAFREHLLLDLADLLFEPLDALFRGRLAALGLGWGQGDKGECGDAGEQGQSHFNPSWSGLRGWQGRPAGLSRR